MTTLTPFSIHRGVIGKPDGADTEDALRTTYNGWENRDTESLKLLKSYVLGKGYCFTFVSLKPDAQYWRHQSQVLEVGGIGLDFDDGLNYQEAQVDPILKTAWLCYPSPSFTPEKPWKFRVLWRFDQPTTDTDSVRLLLAKLMDLYPVDKKCAEPHRLWFGNPGADPLFSSEDDGFVPVDQINQAWESWAIANPDQGHVYQIQRRLERIASGADSSVHQYCPVVDGFYRDDIQVARHLLKHVEPWLGRKTQTYQQAHALLGGLVCWLGLDVTTALINEAAWFWHEAKGPMEDIIQKRFEELQDYPPKGMWFWMFNKLVEEGALTQDERRQLTQFNRRSYRRGS